MLTLYRKEVGLEGDVIEEYADNYININNEGGVVHKRRIHRFSDYSEDFAYDGKMYVFKCIGDPSWLYEDGNVVELGGNKGDNSIIVDDTWDYTSMPCLGTRYRYYPSPMEMMVGIITLNIDGLDLTIKFN